MVYNQAEIFWEFLLTTYRKVSEEGVLEGILSSSNFNYLPRAMTAATIRQEVIANNVANVNTPNYRKSVVNFEDLLAREIYGEEPDGKLAMVRTHDKHLPFKPLDFHAEPTIFQDNTTIMRVDDNNVDIDVEMANMSKNQIYYNALATELGSHITRLKNVITSGQQ